MRSHPLLRPLAAGMVGLGAAITLAACEAPQDTAGQTGTDPALEAPTATDPATEPGTATTAQGNTIVDVAQGDDSFTTLTTALSAAGLTDTLAQDGPFTVFAPTDQAFDALPEGTLERLLQPENRDMLIQVLSYHVVPQQLSSDQLDAQDGSQLETVAGSPLLVQTEGPLGGLAVEGASVVDADIEASNGVIHSIDQVILPPGLDM